MELAQARTRAADAARQAGRSVAEAGRLRTLADNLARAWAGQEREHRRACSEFGFPVDEVPLRRIHDRAGRAVASCATVAVGAGAVAKAMSRYATTVERSGEVTERRAQAESLATAEWRVWRAEATKLETLTGTVGAAAAQVQQQVTATESALKQTKEE